MVGIVTLQLFASCRSSRCLRHLHIAPQLKMNGQICTLHSSEFKFYSKLLQCKLGTLCEEERRTTGIGLSFFEQAVEHVHNMVLPSKEYCQNLKRF